MASKTTIILPSAPAEYDINEEAFNRRAIEQAIQDVFSEIGNIQRLNNSLLSKSVKRHQFLLMGAKSV